MLVIRRQRLCRGGGEAAVERDQHIDRERIERRLVRARGEEARIGVVAEILEQQQPRRAILGLDARRAQAHAVQQPRDGDRKAARPPAAAARPSASPAPRRAGAAHSGGTRHRPATARRTASPQPWAAKNAAMRGLPVSHGAAPRRARTRTATARSSRCAPRAWRRRRAPPRAARPAAAAPAAPAIRSG